jgi:hypothetical protein
MSNVSEHVAHEAYLREFDCACDLRLSDANGRTAWSRWCELADTHAQDGSAVHVDVEDGVQHDDLQVRAAENCFDAFDLGNGLGDASRAEKLEACKKTGRPRNSERGSGLAVLNHRLTTSSGTSYKLLDMNTVP